MSGRLATFQVAGHYLGVDVLEVQEVLRQQCLTRVPLASPVVEGLINLRGQIVPALDMRRLLGLELRAPDAAPLSVVVRTEHGAVSLQVDEMGDVVEVHDSTIDPPPRNVDPRIRALLEGVHQTDEGLLLVLNLARTVDLENAPSARESGDERELWR